jgi:hypothetical protein
MARDWQYKVFTRKIGLVDVSFCDVLLGPENGIQEACCRFLAGLELACNARTLNTNSAAS